MTAINVDVMTAEDLGEYVNIRFIVRKQEVADRWRWTLRDGLCRNCEYHDFTSPYWSEDCDGECDVSIHFSSAIGKVSELQRSGR